MEYTINELIETLKDYPKNLKIQIDCDGAIFEQIHIDRVSNRLVIFTEGESLW